MYQSLASVALAPAQSLVGPCPGCAPSPSHLCKNILQLHTLMFLPRIYFKNICTKIFLRRTSIHISLWQLLLHFLSPAHIKQKIRRKNAVLQNWFPRNIATFYFESFPHLKFTTKLWRTNNCRINQFLPHIFGGGQPNIWQLYRQIFVNERTRSGECIKQVNLFWQYAQKQKHRRCIFFYRRSQSVHRQCPVPASGRCLHLKELMQGWIWQIAPKANMIIC